MSQGLGVFAQKVLIATTVVAMALIEELYIKDVLGEGEGSGPD